MSNDPSPEELVEAVRHSFPKPVRDKRPVHTFGICAKGYFEASEIAKTYSVADHFQGHQVETTVRFSNGLGGADRHDNWSDVRGMATRFHLGQDRATDLIAMTLGEFFVADVKSFMEMTKAGALQTFEPESPWRKIRDLLGLRVPQPNPREGEALSGVKGLTAYANANDKARLGIIEAGEIGVPTSYARATYHAVHTFVVTGPDGGREHVRFTWQPVAGVSKYDLENAPPPEDLDLQQELRDRLAEQGAARFMLMMAIGEAGDHFEDPTRPWPLRRRRVTMGTLHLREAVPETKAREYENMSFNPCRLTPGLELSEDPVLKARKAAYEVSRKIRGGDACPFAGE